MSEAGCGRGLAPAGDGSTLRTDLDEPGGTWREMREREGEGKGE